MLTDIEKSTEKWEKFQKEMGTILARHDAILREEIDQHYGRIVKHTGDGIFAVFEEGMPLHCAIAIQSRFGGEDWGGIGDLRIRIALHAGAAEKRGNDYFGPVINRTARLMEAAWGGQILLTPEVRDYCTLPSGAVLQDLGVHLLHDLGEPQQIFGLTHPDLTIKKFPSLRSLSAHPHNLPAQPTPFVGRMRELQEVAQTVENPAYRLVNIVGPGGVGKTRLALQVAAEKIDKFHHGVFFVPLDSLTIGSVQFLVFTIAGALNFSFYSREDPKVQLINFLREKEMLLIMDNFEHLVTEAELLTEIFKTAYRIKFLITSRERLRLKGEHIIELKGLDYPVHAGDPDFENYSAVQLFLQGARSVNPSYDLTAEDRAALVRIFDLVEGNPLCIELAASWMRPLSTREIVLELEKNIDFLASTVQDLPKRHRSLRAVFDYSWELLSTLDKQLFRKLAVFEGGFTRDAAEKVGAATLAGMSLLVDKSLLRRNPGGRYEMLKILRQYAQEKLAKVPAEHDEARDRHCSYFMELLNSYRAIYLSGKEEQFLTEIGNDIENCKRAWLWAIERGRYEDIAKGMTSMYNFYEMRGWLQEGEELFRMTAEALKKQWSGIPRDHGQRVLLGRILGHWGGLNRYLGQFQKARALLDECIKVLPEDRIDDAMFALNELAVIALKMGDYTLARELHGRVLARREEEGDARAIAISLNNLAIVEYQLNEHGTAIKLHERALQLRTAIGDNRGLASSLNNLANVYHDVSRLSEAIDYLERSLAIRRQINDRSGIASCLNNLGVVKRDQGNAQAAEKFFLESLAIKRDIGDEPGIANTLNNLGNAASDTGQWESAWDYYREALKILSRIKAVPILLDSILGVARLYLARDRRAEGLVLAAFVAAYPSARDSFKKRAQEYLAKATAVELKAANETIRGRRMDDIVNEILRASAIS